MRPGRKWALVISILTALTEMDVRAADVVWSYRTPNGSIDASPAVSDLNGDGNLEVVVATVNGEVAALDREGRELWRVAHPGRMCGAPAVGDVTGDPSPEILLLNREGVLYCLDGATGNRLWDFKFGDMIDWGATGPVVADLAQCGARNIIACDNSGAVACLDGDGRVLWKRQTDIGHPRWPAAADVAGDEKFEVLVAGDTVALLCLSAAGDELWRVAGPLPGSSPLTGDFNRDGKQEIAVGLGASLALLGNDGRTLWSLPMKGEIDSALSAADADGDGSVELYAADLRGHVLCASVDGDELWTGNAVERVRRSPTIADVDGDGKMEILVAGYSGVLYVYAPGGSLKESIPLPGGATNSSPIAADLAGDGAPCVICPTNASQMPVLRWAQTTGTGTSERVPERDVPVPDLPKVLFGEYRGNAARTGTLPVTDDIGALVIEQLDFGDGYVGSNEFRAVIGNPARHTLTLSLEVRSKDREPWTARTESSHDRLSASLQYMLTGDRTEDLEFVCTVTEGARVLLRRTQHVFLVPFRKELADLRQAIRNAEDFFARMDDTRGLVERTAYIKGLVPGLIERADAAGTGPVTERHALRDELRALVAEIRKVVCLARCAVEKCEPGTPVFVCAANPWAPFGGIDELIEGRFGVDGSIEAFHGESEAAAFIVFNLSGESRQFRVEITTPEPLPAGLKVSGIVSIREVVDAPTQAHDNAADALPRLNEAALFVVPPWAARQLWLDVDTAKLAPGDHSFGLHLRTIEEKSVELAANLAVKVWDAAVPEKQPLRLCHWGYVHSSCIKDYPEEALADQLALGTNVFVGLHYPKATFDAGGNLVGEIDFADHDDYVRRHAPNGIILFCGYQGALQGPGKHDEPAYKRAHVAWLRAWVAHLAELGVGYDDFALYPIDEPGLSEGLVEAYLLYAQLAREADPGIRMYTDPVARITMDELQRMAPYVDIWCPNRNGFLLDINADKLAFIKQQGRTHWTYECDDNVKHQSPLGYYRAQAWLVWHHGLTGIGFWSYCTSQNDPWFTPPDGHDYLIIYPGQGVVRSKRWYGIRDGIEDYGMLTVLREALAAAKQANASGDAVQRAEQLLGEGASHIGGFCGTGGTTTPGREGLPGMRAQADAQWREFQQTRRRIMDLLRELRVKG